MKLLKLKIGTQFRSLPDGFEVNFLRDFDRSKIRDFMPYCLAGRNGSGKSNILEALAWIFFHIECTYLECRPADFDANTERIPLSGQGFNPRLSVPGSFELEYETLLNEKDYYGDVTLLNNSKAPVHVVIKKAEKELPEIQAFDIYKNEKGQWSVPDRVLLKSLLPQFIIGYSSGENETLSLPFFKMNFINYDEYEDRLKDERGYNRPEGRLIFLDKVHSQAIFLTNYLMQDEAVLKPFHDVLGIKSIKKFRIIINQTVQKTKPARYNDDLLFDEPDENELTESFELTAPLKRRDVNKTDYKILDKLISCATTWHTHYESNALYLDYYIDEDKKDDTGAILKNEDGTLTGLSEMKKAFRAHFNNDPFELFTAFQVLLNLNLYDIDRKTKKELYRSGSLYFNETIPVLASDRRAFRFKDFMIEKEHAWKELLTKELSDGEHQFLHAIGLCLLFKNTNSLFLLDEPETHLNPDWRAKFISTLKQCLYTNDGDHKFMRDILITSHSPFIISDCHEENVLVFKKDEESGKVEVNRANFRTFGASINQITIEIFNKANTIGDLANESIASFQKRFENGEDIDDLIKEIDDKMGESVEKTILINRLLKNI